MPSTPEAPTASATETKPVYKLDHVDAEGKIDKPKLRSETDKKVTESKDRVTTKIGSISPEVTRIAASKPPEVQARVKKALVILEAKAENAGEWSRDNYKDDPTFEQRIQEKASEYAEGRPDDPDANYFDGLAIRHDQAVGAGEVFTAVAEATDKLTPITEQGKDELAYSLAERIKTQGADFTQKDKRDALVAAGTFSQQEVDAVLKAGLVKGAEGGTDKTFASEDEWNKAVYETGAGILEDQMIEQLVTAAGVKDLDSLPDPDNPPAGKTPEQAKQTVVDAAKKDISDKIAKVAFEVSLQRQNGVLGPEAPPPPTETPPPAAPPEATPATPTAAEAAIEIPADIKDPTEREQKLVKATEDLDKTRDDLAKARRNHDSVTRRAWNAVKRAIGRETKSLGDLRTEAQSAYDKALAEQTRVASYDKVEKIPEKKPDGSENLNKPLAEMTPEQRQKRADLLKDKLSANEADVKLADQKTPTGELTPEAQSAKARLEAKGITATELRVAQAAKLLEVDPAAPLTPEQTAQKFLDAVDTINRETYNLEINAAKADLITSEMSRMTTAEAELQVKRGAAKLLSEWTNSPGKRMIIGGVLMGVSVGATVATGGVAAVPFLAAGLTAARFGMSYTGMERTITGLEQKFDKGFFNKPKDATPDQAYAKARQIRIARGIVEESDEEKQLLVQVKERMESKLNTENLDVKNPEARANVVDKLITDAGKDATAQADQRFKDTARRKLIAVTAASAMTFFGADIARGVGSGLGFVGQSMDNFVPGFKGAKDLLWGGVQGAVKGGGEAWANLHPPAYAAELPHPGAPNVHDAWIEQGRDAVYGNEGFGLKGKMEATIGEAILNHKPDGVPIPAADAPDYIHFDPVKPEHIDALESFQKAHPNEYRNAFKAFGDAIVNNPENRALINPNRPDIVPLNQIIRLPNNHLNFLEKFLYGGAQVPVPEAPPLPVNLPVPDAPVLTPGILDQAGQLKDAAGQAIGETVDAATQTAGTSGALGATGEGIGGALGSTGQGVGGALGETGRGIGGALGATGEGIGGALGSTGQGVGGALGETGRGIGETITSAPDNLQAVANAAGQAIGERVDQAGALKDQLVGQAGALRDQAGQGLNDLTAQGQAGLDRLGTGVRGLADQTGQLKDAAIDTLNAVGQAKDAALAGNFSGVGDAVRNTGIPVGEPGATVGGTVDAATRAAGALRDQAGQGLNDLTAQGQAGLDRLGTGVRGLVDQTGQDSVDLKVPAAAGAGFAAGLGTAALLNRRESTADLSPRAPANTATAVTGEVIPQPSPPELNPRNTRNNGQPPVIEGNFRVVDDGSAPALESATVNPNQLAVREPVANGLAVSPTADIPTPATDKINRINRLKAEAAAVTPAAGTALPVTEPVAETPAPLNPETTAEPRTRQEAIDQQIIDYLIRTGRSKIADPTNHIARTTLLSEFMKGPEYSLFFNEMLNNPGLSADQAFEKALENKERMLR